MDQWLVRTANNILAGPYSREQVVNLIQEGKLGLQDEVCQANHYWIFLHEHIEVERQLGMSMPRAPRNDDEEITETQTDATESVSEASPQVEIALAPIPVLPEDYEGGTAVMSRGAFRDAKSNSLGMPAPSGSQSHGSTFSPSTAAPTPSQVQTVPRAAAVNGASTSAAAAPRSVGIEPQIERPSIWKSFAWLMIFVSCVIVFVVLRLLRSSGV